MKKILGILLLITLLFGLAACDPSDGGSGDGGDQGGGESNPDNGGADNGGENDPDDDTQKGEQLSYLDDMSKYVTVSREDYSDIRLTSAVRKPTDKDVENEIIKLLYSNKAKEGTSYTDISEIPAVSAGDNVSIYYRGYYVEDGARVYFDGGCNLSSSAGTLGIGSGQFISGFELGLVGKKPSEFVSIETLSEGSVLDGDIVIISYEYIPYGGTATTKSGVVVDLSDDVDALFGVGFRELIVGAELGVTGTGSILVDNNGKSDVITSVRVGRIFRAIRTGERGEELPVLTVSAYFPADYGKAELNGREAFFDVYIMSSTVYDTPDFDDAFVTGTLKMTAADLEGYAGESLADKYRSAVLEYLTDDYSTELRSELMNSVVEYIFGKASTVSLPEEVLLYQYNYIYDQMAQMYEQYSYYYPTIDSFAIAYFGLEDGADWQATIRDLAEDAFLRQAAFYYVGQAEGFIPEGEALDGAATELYNAELDAFLEYYGVVRDKFDTESEYNAAVLEYAGYFSEYYTLDYFREAVVFESIFDGILENFVTLE